MSPGATFDRVYRALKAEIAQGRFASGERLEPSPLGERLNASVTPVRHALRLVGEGVVEAPRQDGFRVPFLTESDLCNLYAWRLELLQLALRATASPFAALRPADAPGAPADELPRRRFSSR